MATYSNNNKVAKQVVNAKKNYGYTYKQITKQANDKTNITLKDGSVLTPYEAWRELNVPATKAGVAKACDIKKIWYAGFRTADGCPMVRVKENLLVTVMGKDYKLYSMPTTRKGIKFWVLRAMRNAADVDKEQGDVKVTLERLLSGLYDCRFFETTKKEIRESQEAACATTEGYVNTGDQDTPKWAHVTCDANGYWHFDSNVVDIDAKIA